MRFKDIRRFDIPVDNTLFKKKLSPLNNFSYDCNGLFFNQFAMPGEVLHKITLGAKLSDKEVVLGIFVYIFKFYDVGMLQFLQDIDLVVKHFDAGSWIFFGIDHFEGKLAFPLNAPALVDFAGVALSDKILLPEDIIPNSLALVTEQW